LHCVKSVAVLIHFQEQPYHLMIVSEASLVA
jgi:hypothetical protein